MVQLKSCDGFVFFVPKNVICNASGYMKNVLNSDYRESKELVVELDLVRGEVLESVIQYASKLFYFANQFHMRDNMVVQFGVKPHLVMELAVYSSYLIIPGLYTLTLIMLSEYIDDVPPLDYMPPDIVESILRSLDGNTLLRAELRSDIQTVNIDTTDLWKELCIRKGLSSNYSSIWDKPKFPLFREILSDNIFDWIDKDISYKKKYLQYLISNSKLECPEFSHVKNEILCSSDTYILTNNNTEQEFDVKDYSFLKKLIVIECDTSDHWTEKLKHLHSLHLRAPVSFSFMDIIVQNNGIQVLEMHQTRLVDRTVISLCNILKDYDIHKISVSNNFITYNGFEAICSISSPNFHYLNFSGNPLNLDHVTGIELPNFSSSQLEHLDLSGCDLVRVYQETNFSAFLSTIPSTLKSLNLSNCKLNHFLIKRCDSLYRLKYLDLSCNTIGDTLPLDTLVQHPECRIKCLNLGRNHLFSEREYKLFSLCHSIEYISIEYNRISDDGMMKIVDLIESNPNCNIKAILYKGNSLSKKVMQKVRSKLASLNIIFSIL
eukprot:TRINITY_DN1406_c0_g1_i1.p1 TRINITY_DN1406_c0_g1~~TRINITY_DN1406_c0_g1_i1.p1  ORF type:complete len:548 (+),score=89.52 TRINITY_DN1406_c0_g1_i1:170-1813(+)